MTGRGRYARRLPGWRSRALLVLALWVGILGMHGLAPVAMAVPAAHAHSHQRVQPGAERATRPAAEHAEASATPETSHAPRHDDCRGRHGGVHVHDGDAPDDSASGSVVHGRQDGAREDGARQDNARQDDARHSRGHRAQASGREDCHGHGGGAPAHHADPTCAAGSLGGPPALAPPGPDPVSLPHPDEARRSRPERPQHGGRAPPSLAELQLLRI
ncbi:DUF6153 family protein [Streptomyces sp. NPDC002055]|uniref:DUF6153 family protein n=1 Tax=Streptomyces sp. NPDC002055 TaxID=3154534 RepID=UPI00333079A9